MSARAVTHAMAAWLVAHPDARVHVRGPLPEQRKGTRSVPLVSVLGLMAQDASTRAFLGAVLEACPRATVGEVLDALEKAQAAVAIHKPDCPNVAELLPPEPKP